MEIEEPSLARERAEAATELGCSKAETIDHRLSIQSSPTLFFQRLVRDTGLEFAYSFYGGGAAGI
jgi:hypothetical protein